jgi:hypothetical protein
MSKTLRPHYNVDGVQVLAEIPGVGIILSAGDTVPADASEGFAPGCIFIKTDGTTLDNTTYTNIGTKASSNFDAQVNS